MMERVTLKDLAKMAGVSVNTVSRALNDKDGVKEETKDRIRALSKRFGYEPNMLARSMKYNTSNLLGILVGDITNTFFTQLLKGAEEEANKFGKTILIGNSSEDPAKERDTVNTFMSYNCSGIILSPVDGNAEIVRRLQERKANFVVIDRDVNVRCDKVYVDNESGAYDAICHLLLRGHRKIAIIASNSKLNTEKQRLSGYLKALTEKGVPVDERYISKCDTSEEACAWVSHIMRVDDPPTALFITRQLYGLSVLSTLRSLSLRVPEDVSLVVYGEPDWAMVFTPGITCVRRPIKEIGILAVRTLIDKIARKSEDKPLNICLKTELIVRDSVKHMG